MGTESARTTAQHRTAVRRAGLGLAIGAACMVVAFGATSTVVGAVTTERSTVHGNRFATALRTAGGVYELAATPEHGTAFGPGPALGTVSFAMLPEGTDAVELEAGDTITIDVALPAGVVPGDLAPDDAGRGYTRSWAAAETGGRWTVSQSVTATATGRVALPGARFPITTDLVEVRPSEDLTIEASARLPERYVSTHPTDRAVIPAHWNVEAGVYGLEVSGGASNTVDISFASHPEDAGEYLALVPGDVMSTEVSLPAGVSPAALPDATEAAGIASSWTSARVGQGWTVTHTQTVTAPRAEYGPVTGAFTASVTPQAWNDGYTLTAAATLPARFTSAQARMATEVPGRVSPPGIGRIAAGGGQSIAISQAYRDGYGWGVNAFGQVGSGTTAAQVTAPTRLRPLGIQPYLQVAAGAQHTIGLSADLRLYGWGADHDRQTGTPQGTAGTVLTPTEAIPTQSVAFTQVAAGTRTSLALDRTGRAWGWGSRASGALGSSGAGSHVDRPTPLAQPADVSFMQLAAGNQTTFGVDTAGRVWGMGSNANGRLGLGTGVAQTGEFTRVPMPDDARIVQLAVNGSTENQQALALTDAGEIIAWGMNAGGEAGIGVDGSQPAAVWTPRKIQAPEGVRFTKLAAGDGVSLALSETGHVYSWGIQTLGYATPYQTAVPTLVPLPVVPGGIVDIAAGDAHALALGATNELYGWGMHNGGRLGTSETGFQVTPTRIDLALARTADDKAEAGDPEADAAATGPAEDSEDSEDPAEPAEADPDGTSPAPADDSEAPAGHGTDADTDPSLGGDAPGAGDGDGDAAVNALSGAPELAAAAGAPAATGGSRMRRFPRAPARRTCGGCCAGGSRRCARTA
ncbi:hypothetical protein [Leucobacter chromiireducens]|uniref:Alpha-tubulin suppressor-like RCC1 family protein n=1 Tax=Leucobacter chromiireducens subsp. solipictus TaxID=398235 RepID=A0ABS1SIU1_9MICO|nr:hypothetical protein [Leucobacter chromiireducens subsp. solipictus]